jgi:outer membrane protein OmpA-like peptidoglycan-associated protein
MERTIEDYICELRADIVTSYLLKEGVSFSKLEVSLIGTNVLANDCREGVSCSDAQHQANRRVKFILQ